MNQHLQQYQELRLGKCKEAFASNSFGTYLAKDCREAKRIVIDDILPGIGPKTVSWGDSMTLYTTGILEEIKQRPAIDVVEIVAENVP